MARPLTSVFADQPAPRSVRANTLHTLTNILALATCAMIAGAGGREVIAQYGQSKDAFSRRLLELRNGAPSHDPFYRVFAHSATDAFADRFARWARSARVPGRPAPTSTARPAPPSGAA